MIFAPSLNVIPENFLFGLRQQDERKFVRNLVRLYVENIVLNFKRNLPLGSGQARLFAKAKKRAFRNDVVGWMLRWVTAVFLLVIISQPAFAYMPIKAASIPNATMMKVHIGSGEKAIDVDITDADAIAGVLAFVNAHLEGWKAVEGTPPLTEVNLRFFIGQNQIGTFGSDATYFTRGNPATLVHNASAKDIKTFLDLANIDPAKLQNQPHD